MFILLSSHLSLTGLMVQLVVAFLLIVGGAVAVVWLAYRRRG